MSSNTIVITPARRVMLRNRSHAMLTHGVAGLPPFSVMGHIEHEPAAVQLWHSSGRWLEQKAVHALDIVAIYTDAGRVPFVGIDLRAKS